MIEKQTLIWIKDNLGEIIRKAISDSGSVIYSEDWLAALVMRETGVLIMRYVPRGNKFEDICMLMKGDYGKRKGETELRYHGFGFFQIDIDSFPDFVASGDWKDPYKCSMMAIKVLHDKEKYLLAHWPENSLYNFERAVCASYNTGEGNVIKSIKAGRDVDSTTYNHDYSKSVWHYRDIYKAL